MGYRFLRDEAEAVGWSISRRTALELTSNVHRLPMVVKRVRESVKTLELAIVDDFLGRGFTAHAADRVWLTEFSEHATEEGNDHFGAFQDLFLLQFNGFSLADDHRETCHSWDEKPGRNAREFGSVRRSF